MDKWRYVENDSCSSFHVLDPTQVPAQTDRVGPDGLLAPVQDTMWYLRSKLGTSIIHQKHLRAKNSENIQKLSSHSRVLLRLFECCFWYTYIYICLYIFYIYTFMRWKAWKTDGSFHHPDNDWGITQRWGNSVIRWSWTSKSMKRSSSENFGLFWMKTKNVLLSTRISCNLCRSSITIDSFDAFQSLTELDVKVAGSEDNWLLRMGTAPFSAKQLVHAVDRPHR